jgi:hypothetical protein
MLRLRQRLLRSASAAAFFGSVLTLAGCADGVELNGKVFDWMGVSPAAMESQRREPKMSERAPLVLPPDANRLPEPGSGQAGRVDDPSWPADPEKRKLAQAQERERLHMAYCKGEIQWKERALNKDESAPRSPFGPCPGLFGGLTNGINKN